jgi:hypothetical protein
MLNALVMEQDADGKATPHIRQIAVDDLPEGCGCGGRVLDAELQGWSVP